MDKPLPVEEYKKICDDLFRRMRAGVSMGMTNQLNEYSFLEKWTQIEAAHSEIVSLTALLIQKGVLTQAEVQDTIITGLKSDIMRMENGLSDALGTTITID
jgi:hypothetical protein